MEVDDSDKEQDYYNIENITTDTLTNTIYESAVSGYDVVSEYSSSKSVSDAIEESSDEGSQLKSINYQRSITRDMNHKSRKEIKKRNLLPSN